MTTNCQNHTFIYNKNVIESSPKKFFFSVKEVLRASGAKYIVSYEYTNCIWWFCSWCWTLTVIYENRDLRVSAKIPGQIFFRL